jgi:hypothetical protein
VVCISMNCQVCGEPIGEESVDKVIVLGKKFSLCGWCEYWVERFIMGQIAHNVINISWGAGKVCQGEMGVIRDFIRAHNITEVLEFGSGLSTEIFAMLGLKIVTCDVLANHSRLLSQLETLKGIADVIHYEYGTPPDFDTLYPGRKWDFVFVDGPQERLREVALAMKLANKYIYLHDPNMGEQSFFPNDEWIGIGAEPRLFVKKGVEI